ncbi:zinc finger SWIM-type containing 2 [Perkinsus chesapeaki]|uniref:Zinc finger SWIM-type containing 2 n=1 Tax=Perkinsus chesapeaki TaxID=330153 RepID=A0A7J6MNX9_PERCH|nr:zinc finger SWIM-type containing 2 [Perkinsus chesapeaki]
MAVEDFFILKLAFGKESLQCRCRYDTISDVKQLHRLIKEAWPNLKSTPYRATLRGGQDLIDWPSSHTAAALIKEGLADSVYAMPRLKLRVTASHNTSGKVDKSKKPWPMDGHKPAGVHLASCYHCDMFPVVGRCFACSTCPSIVLCSWCFDEHDKSHTITPLAMAFNGLWEGSFMEDNARDMTDILRNRHRPWSGDTVNFNAIQVGENPLPSMVAEIFSRSEPHHEELTRFFCDDGKSLLCYRHYCHACGCSASVMRQFQCDGRGDINLCDACYILWRDEISKISFKCSRLFLPGSWNPLGVGPWELVHYGVACEECGMFPIRGRRYHCNFCTEHDLCESCYKETANRNHRETHLFTLVVKPIKAWTVQTRKPKGILLSTLRCERCGQGPSGGARYTMVALPGSRYCGPCYKEALRFEALCIRGPYNRGYEAVNEGAFKIRQGKLKALEDSLASTWLMESMDRQLKGQDPFPLPSEHSPNSVVWADEPPKALKPHHRTLLYPPSQ